MALCSQTVRSSICSFICYKTCEHNILKTSEPTDFDTSGHKWSVEQVLETLNFRNQKIKGKGHMWPK